MAMNLGVSVPMFNHSFSGCSAVLSDSSSPNQKFRGFRLTTPHCSSRLYIISKGSSDPLRLGRFLANSRADGIVVFGHVLAVVTTSPQNFDLSYTSLPWSGPVLKLTPASALSSDEISRLLDLTLNRNNDFLRGSKSDDEGLGLGWLKGSRTKPIGLELGGRRSRASRASERNLPSLA